MALLKTSYLGMELKNPFIAGASSLTSQRDTAKRLEDTGAAALVTPSLFEEQIQLESFVLEEEIHRFDNLYAEMTDLFPEIKHSGPEAHLRMVADLASSLEIPVIASLNAVQPETWVHYAGLLAETGAKALELNFYATPTDPSRSGKDIEQEQLAILRKIKEKVALPLSVKLSPFYTNPLHVIRSMEEAGADGFVLFNRFFEPLIDPQKERNLIRHTLSGSNDNGITLRFTGLIGGESKGDICASSGIMTGLDAASMILAGASCVQVVSTLYKNPVGNMAGLIEELESWMETKGYPDLYSFRGKLSAKNNPDRWAYRRAQYVKMLMDPAGVIKTYPSN
ncbi:MAG: dihydroorotate dehydrogenase-like protein [Spirochaetales bacterium]|nr:dihydroorotate dehydrogenase-like protein [Spirochaetales bacterium]